MECLCHLILVNEFKTATISIPDPYDSENIMNLFVHARKNPKLSVKLINNMPYIECNIFLNADIQSLDENSDYSTKELLDEISNYANEYLEKTILDYLYKMSKEYNSDIDNFGKYMIKNYSTWNEWIDSDWLYNYKNSFFLVKVNTNVQNGQLYTKI